MPLTPTYLLRADQCPAISLPAALLNPKAASASVHLAPVASSITPAQTVAGVDAINQNAAQLDVTGRYGGGAWAIAEGLELSFATGLTLQVGTGAAMIDGPVVLTTALTAACSNNIYDVTDITKRIHVWLLQTGGLSLVNNSLAPPAGAVCYLGSVTTAGGAGNGLDYSGRLYVRGSLWRRTGDAGMPTDSPPSVLRGMVTQTAGGVYLWDGAAYVRAWEPLALSQDTIQSTDRAAIPAGQQAVLHHLQIDGSLLVDGTIYFP